MFSLIYIADPMCSWCWGFSPVISALQQESGLDVNIIPGGLRPGEMAQPLDAKLKRLLRHHWRQVSELSGQPFNDSFFERENFLYDTEMPCRAVNAMNRVQPVASLPYLSRIQRAFYAENADITDPEVLADFAVEFTNAPLFYEQLVSVDNRNETWQLFYRVADWGIGGFPALLLHRHGAEHLIALARGYQPLEEVRATLHRALAET